MKIIIISIFIIIFISSTSISVDDINNICKDGSKQLQDYYFENKEYSAKSFPISSESYIPTIIEAIDAKNLNSLIQDKNFLKSYGKHIIIILFFLLCGFLSILGIIACCFNYLFCNCCCCFLKKCCSRSISFIVTLSIFGSIVFICFFGVAAAKNSIMGFNNVACALLKFVSDIIDGQSKNSYPKWVGIDNLKNTFDDIKKNLNESQKANGEDFYSNYNSLMVEQNKYISNTDVEMILKKNKDSSENFFQFTLNKDDYKNLEKDITLIPNYIRYWEDNITYPNNNKEILDHLFLSNLLLSNMKVCEKQPNTKYDCNKESIIYKELTEGTKYIDKFQNTISDLEINLVNPFYNYEKMLNDYGKKYVKYVFYIIMLISGFLTILIFILNCDCDSKMNCISKILLYIFLIIISIFMVISFILGGLLGIIGNLSKDLTYVIGKILDEDNLNKIEPAILKGEGVKYINICLHNNHKNLANAFLSNLDEDSSSSSDDITVTKFLGKIPSLYQNLLLDEKNLDLINKDNIFDNLKNYIKYSKEKYFNIDYYNTDLTIHNMSKYLEDFNGFTYRKYNSSCNVYDYWTTSSKKYNIYSNLIENFYSDNNCFFDEVKYKFSNLNDAANNFLKFLKEIKDKNEYLINNKINLNSYNYNVITNENNKVLVQLKKATFFAIKLTGSIAIAYNSILGDGEFEQLLDCGFIKDDLNILLNELHSKLANSLIKFGLILGIISCLIAIGICMMLLNLTLSKDIKENDKKVYNQNKKNKIKQYEKNEINSERMILRENK